MQLRKYRSQEDVESKVIKMETSLHLSSWEMKAAFHENEYNFEEYNALNHRLRSREMFQNAQHNSLFENLLQRQRNATREEYFYIIFLIL